LTSQTMKIKGICDVNTLSNMCKVLPRDQRV
jgi:hypothetical protein